MYIVLVIFLIAILKEPQTSIFGWTINLIQIF